MSRGILTFVIVFLLLTPFISEAQESSDCDPRGYAEKVQPILDATSVDMPPQDIDGLRLRLRDIVPDACTVQHYYQLQYALSELYISVLLKDIDPTLSTEHGHRFQSAWEAAADLFAEIEIALGERVESAATVQEVERDGLSRETAFLLGEPGSILDGEGTFVIERVVRGATYRDARALNYQRADSGKEFLLVWGTFTCQQRLCGSIQNSPFFLVGDEQVVYGNLVYVRGGEFPDQLAGQPMQGGSVSGWLWFQVSQSDTNLFLIDNGDSPRFFSLSAFPPGAEFVTVIAGGNVNLRGCASTDCNVVGQAASGQQLMILDVVGDWFHIRASDGTEGYVFGNLVRR